MYTRFGTWENNESAHVENKFNYFGDFEYLHLETNNKSPSSEAIFNVR